MCKEEDEIQFVPENVAAPDEKKKEENKYKGYPEAGEPPKPPEDIVEIDQHSAGVKEDCLKLKAMEELYDIELSDMSNKAK